MAEVKFPTEVVDLPSQGLLYLKFLIQYILFFLKLSLAFVKLFFIIYMYTHKIKLLTNKNYGTKT